MIKSDKGTVQIEGVGLDILAETTTLLLGVYDALKSQGELFAIACMESIIKNFKEGLAERIGGGIEDIVEDAEEEETSENWWD